MRVLICGFGSIGRRHLRNLKALGLASVILYRTGRSTLPEDELAGLPVEYDLGTALAHQPDAVIVSNPTALHLPTALAAARAGCHLFLEKPISHSMDGVADLRREVTARNLCVLIGFQFRFHPALRQIKAWLDEGLIGPVVSVQAQWGEYLPGWHPWEDYRQGYSARADMGGGVVLTLCHPFDYLRWLVGDVIAVSAMTGHLSGLELDVEDTAQIMLRFASGAIGSVYLDYVQRPPSHWLRIVGQAGNILWDNSDGIAHCYSAKRDQWQSFAPPTAFERNAMFLDEMRHFLACIEGREQPVCTLEDGIEALRIALAVKQSALEERSMPL